MTAFSSPRRKRGAPLGNTNAFKHGFYTRSFTRADQECLETAGKGELRDEEELIRVALIRAGELLNDSSLSVDQKLLAIRTIFAGVGRIESIHRSRKVVYEQATTLEKALEELKSLPLAED
jgi:hypothetical protein